MISDEAALAILKSAMDKLRVTCPRHTRTNLIAYLNRVWCPDCGEPTDEVAERHPCEVCGRQRKKGAVRDEGFVIFGAGPDAPGFCNQCLSRMFKNLALLHREGRP